jgi:hypothetical protein
VLAVQQAGIWHRYIKPGYPQQNGKVQLSDRIAQQVLAGDRLLDAALRSVNGGAGP